MTDAERRYFELIESGAKPEAARSVLPNSLKTEIVVTMNLREWRHFFELRTSRKSHPQMREVACKTLRMFKERIPVIFDDISDPGEKVGEVKEALKKPSMAFFLRRKSKSAVFDFLAFSIGLKTD